MVFRILGSRRCSEYLEHYIELVNQEKKSFSEALEELVDIEKKNNQIQRENANVKIANFPFIKSQPIMKTGWKQG